MAKVPFSKLQIAINTDESKNFYLNKNEEKIYYTVKKYLPIKDKLDLISRIINQSVDDNGYYNPVKVKIFTTLEVVFTYTNLSFTEKMKEDPCKLYDSFVSTEFFNDILNAIDEKEWIEIQDAVKNTIENIYKYKNSIMGILDSMSTDYNNLSLEASDIQKKLADGEGIGLLQEIMTKLG